MDTERFAFVVAKPEHAAELSVAFAECFQHEAMSKHLGLVPEDWARFGKLYSQKCTSEGHTSLAIDTTDGAIAAFSICEDLVTTVPDGLEAVLGRLTSVLDLVDTLNEEHDREAPEYKAKVPGHTIHLWCLGVGERFRGAKLGFKVAQHSMQLAEKNGYQRAMIEATGTYSQRIAGKLGFVKRHEVV